MLLSEFSHSDSLQLYIDVSEVVEINSHMRGLWGLTGTLRNLQSESNHIIFLNSLLHDSVQVILHFIWEICLEGKWFDYCDFHSFAPFLTFFPLNAGKGWRWDDGKSLSFSSVQFSRSVVSDSLWPHESQDARPPCPSPTPRVHPNPCPLSQWCHPTISSSVSPFSSCPQSFPASGSFQMSQLSASSGQNVGVAASASVLPMNIQDWFPLGWTGLSRVFSNTTLQKHQFFSPQLSL